MLDKNYEKRINKLRKRILEMAKLAEEQVKSIFFAIENNNKEISDKVILNDEIINDYDIKIDKTCQKIFALNQPVASDLRFILSTFLINNRVEFIGDLVVDIAKTFRNIHYTKPIFFSKLAFNDIFRLTLKMTEDAFKSISDNNSSLAQIVLKDELLLNELNMKNIELIKSILKDNPEFVDEAFAMFQISNFCEQIGDYAASIAEDVFFMVESQMIRHNYEKIIFGENSDDDD
ncbi:MAG: phosphate signaling complex protein PhoU [Candidatus Kapabacteria bacterium]|nr:phosphate signaling complex protein PhoU [Ignavibacteriota bacterium]MCW5886186.1 phosphate signaling complex protein PhoU [Candidatus Kapabacteria bacterium]